MKPLLLLVVCFLTMQVTQAQLKTSTQNQCGTFVVDILEGKVNGVTPKYNQAQIKSALTCFTSAEPEDATSKCGGLISYKTQDVYFYTGRHYIEIRDKFKGKLSIPLMGATRNSSALFKLLGNPKMKDTNWDQYDTYYGLVILYYNKLNKVNKIQFSTETSATINLCQ
jgi:hypothetical protein